MLIGSRIIALLFMLLTIKENMMNAESAKSEKLQILAGIRWLAIC